MWPNDRQLVIQFMKDFLGVSQSQPSDMQGGGFELSLDDNDIIFRSKGRTSMQDKSDKWSENQ